MDIWEVFGIISYQVTSGTHRRETPAHIHQKKKMQENLYNQYFQEQPSPGNNPLPANGTAGKPTVAQSQNEVASHGEKEGTTTTHNPVNESWQPCE